MLRRGPKAIEIVATDTNKAALLKVTRYDAHFDLKQLNMEGHGHDGEPTEMLYVRAGENVFVVNRTMAVESRVRASEEGARTRILNNVFSPLYNPDPSSSDLKPLGFVRESRIRRGRLRLGGNIVVNIFDYKGNSKAVETFGPITEMVKVRTGERPTIDISEKQSLACGDVNRITSIVDDFQRLFEEADRNMQSEKRSDVLVLDSKSNIAFKGTSYNSFFGRNQSFEKLFVKMANEGSEKSANGIGADVRYIDSLIVCVDRALGSEGHFEVLIPGDTGAITVGRIFQNSPIRVGEMFPAIYRDNEEKLQLPYPIVEIVTVGERGVRVYGVKELSGLISSTERQLTTIMDEFSSALRKESDKVDGRS